ncbi:EamA family transporter [Motilibacter rhizosphaerae]|nr:EamA family transporter [Motilibacter rhizosphaerae]
MPPDLLGRPPAPALVLGAIASVQCGSAVARTLFDDLSPSTVVLLRLVVSAVVLLAITRPRVWRWTREQALSAVVLGLAMGGMNLVFYESLQRVPLGVAVTVEFLGPMLLALAQSRGLVEGAWALLAGVGVALLGLAGGGSAPALGLLLAFLAGLLWAAYILASARTGRLLPGTQGLAVSLAVGAVLAALVTGVSEPHTVAKAFTHGSLLAHGAAVALLSSLVPYSLEMSALRRMPTRVFGVLMSLEPLGATLAGLAILGQRLTVVEVVALVLVSAASVGVTLGARAAAAAAA